MTSTAERARPGQFDLSLLTGQELTVGEFASREPLKFATNSIVQISDWTGASQATVVRTARTLGFAGIKQMKLACSALVEESRELPAVLRSRLANLPHAGTVDSAIAVAQRVADNASALIADLVQQMDPKVFGGAVTAMDQAERVVLYGLGTAQHVAGYGALELERIGIPARALTGSGHTLADALVQLQPRDALLVLAPRLLFGDVIAFLEHAGPKVGHCIVATQDPTTYPMHGNSWHIPLPATTNTAAGETVTAWVLIDMIVADLALRNSDRALAKRAEIQRYRNLFSPKKTK